jgi:hypothetical protein
MEQHQQQDVVLKPVLLTRGLKKQAGFVDMSRLTGRFSPRMSNGPFQCLVAEFVKPRHFALSIRLSAPFERVNDDLAGVARSENYGRPFAPPE